MVEEMTVPLGFAPSLRLDGPLDDEVPGAVGEQMLGAAARGAVQRGPARGRHAASR